MPTHAAPTPAPEPADLLAEAGWLRSLARRLVSDEAQADDLVQETWRRALERPPRDRRALPAWLARVARNTAAEQHRRNARRRAREARVARPERLPAAAEVVARTELHRRLVDALLALEEPFRSTLLLRYFDDLTPKEIARRTGVPAATVRTRVKRGLDRLRTRMDDTHGGKRRAWILPLVPSAQDAGATAAGTSAALLGGVVAMSTGKQIGIVVGAALSLLIAGVIVVPRLLSDGTPPERYAPAPLESAGNSDEPQLEGRQDPQPEAQPVIAAAAAHALGPWGLRGTVKEVAGAVVRNATVEVTFERGGVSEVLGRAHTGAEGAFEFDLSSLREMPPLLRSPGGLSVQAWADGYAPGPEDTFSLELGERTDLAGLAPALILVPGHVFVGRILDARGEPVAGVQVWAAHDGGQERFVARSRPDGSWRTRIKATGRYALRAAAPGYGSGRAPVLDVAADTDVEVPDIILSGGGTIVGLARFPDGTPAAFVEVTAAATMPQRFVDSDGLLTSKATADADGRFSLRGLRRGRYALRPDRFRQSDKDPLYETGESAAMLVIHTRRVLVEVRDPEGRPVSGTQVSGDWVHADGSVDFSTRRTGRDGRHAFWLAPGERLLVSADVPGSTYAEAAIDVGEKPWDRLVVLTLEPMSDATGRVRLRVTGNGGEPVPNIVATVQTLLTGSLLRGLYEVEPDADGLLPPVPVGTWSLELQPGLTKRSMPIELYFPLSERVTVNADEVTEVALVAKRGGRIRLTLRKPPGSALTGRDVAIAVMRTPQGAPESLGAWVAPNARGWRMGGFTFDAPCIGSKLLTPGTYRLGIEAKGHERIEQEVGIGAGEIVDVTVDLETGTSTAATGDPAKGAAGPQAVDLDDVKLGQLKWDNTSLAEILGYLAGKLGVELQVTKKAKPVVDGAQVFLHIDGQSARTCLELLTAPHELTWNAAGKSLWIGTADERMPAR